MTAKEIKDYLTTNTENADTMQEEWKLPSG